MLTFAQASIEHAAQENELLAALEKPRMARLAWPNQIIFMVVALAGVALFFWCVFEIMSANNTAIKLALSHHLLFPILAAIAILVFAVHRGMHVLSDAKLIKNGECVFGRIVSQKRVSFGTDGGTCREIVYSFAVGCGKPMMGRTRDRTDSYEKDMPILGFFDPEDISRNVGYCSTDWRVQTREGVWLEP
jgi:hypothetical protein